MPHLVSSVAGVPRLASFYGIAIYLYWRDHDPPHIHAQYAGHEALVAIEGGRVLVGGLPARALRLVEEWRSLHVGELRLAWERAARHEHPGTIDPLP